MGNSSESQVFLLMMERVVSEFGNYADLYDAYLEKYVPRKGLNLLVDMHTRKPEMMNGLLHSSFWVKLEVQGPDPLPGSTLDSIVSRGYLRCGLARSSPGFATTENVELLLGYHNLNVSGLDVEFCRALSAAIFKGQTENRIEYRDLSNTTENSAYSLLADGDLDVVIEARWMLQADYLEPTTGQGYTFSPPYYYDMDTMDAYTLMTKQSDPQFSDFVYWTVMAIIYAEEEGILQESSGDMPLVALFGESFKQMFLDAIMAVGSYGEAYSRTAERIVPRSGANMLNKDYGPPAIPPAIGLDTVAMECTLNFMVSLLLMIDLSCT